MNMLAKELLRIADDLKVAVTDPKEVNRIFEERGLKEVVEDPESSYNRKHPDAPQKSMRVLVDDYVVDSQTGKLYRDVAPLDTAAYGTGKAFRENTPHTHKNSAPGFYPVEDDPEGENSLNNPKNIADVFVETDDIFQKALGRVVDELKMLVKLAKELSEISIPWFETLKEANEDGTDFAEAEGVKDALGSEYFEKYSQFKSLYSLLRQYIAAVRPMMTEYQKVILIIDNVAIRFNDVRSKARPGSLQALADSKEWGEDQWKYVQDPQKGTDARARMQMMRTNLKKMEDKTAKLFAVLRAIHDERVQTMNDLTGFKQYLHGVNFLFRRGNGQLVLMEEAAIGQTSEFDPDRIGHGDTTTDSAKPKKGLAKASINRTAISWRGILDKIKGAFVKAYDFIKDALTKVGEMFGIVRKSQNRLLDLANQLTDVLAEIEE